MGHGMVFDAETFGGKDVAPAMGGGWRGGRIEPDKLAKAPLTAKARADLDRAVRRCAARLSPRARSGRKKDWLARHSYKQFLMEKVGV